MAEEQGQIPWGWFPAEQFLIRRWDAGSPLDPDEQRYNLIEKFNETDALPDSWAPRKDGTLSRVPTESEIREILDPWRSQKLRRVAHALSSELDQDMIILRTFYGPGSDAKMAAILEDDEEGDVGFQPDIQWWRVLDDAELFDFGDDWRQVLHVLPELIGHDGVGRISRPLSAEDIAEIWAELNDPRAVIQGMACHGHPVLIADEDALNEKELGALFLDGYGNVVRDSSIKPEDVGDMKVVKQHRGPDNDCWRDGRIGPMYKRGGRMAQKLYPQKWR